MKPEEEQSRLCHQIVMEAHDAIIVADREGVIRLWNRGAEIIFGFSPAEALGRSLHIIIPENLREPIHFESRSIHLVRESHPGSYLPSVQVQPG